MVDDSDLHRALGRMEGKLDTLAMLMQDHVKKDTQDFAAVHERVNRLSAKQNYMLGAAAGVGAAVSAVIAFVKG